MMIPDIPRGGFGPAAPPTHAQHETRLPLRDRSQGRAYVVMDATTMKFRSARTVVQEHISNVNAFQDSLQTPPLPPTLITEHANGEGGKAAIVAPSSPPSLTHARGPSSKSVPWNDEKYLKTLYDACECIGYALEKDSTILMKEQLLIQCLVNTLRQIISPNHSIQNESSFSPDENRSGTTRIPLVEDMKI